jgi:hypothetical protein
MPYGPMPDAKAGISQDGPASWPDGPLGLSWTGLKHNRAFNVQVHNDAVWTAVGAIFGRGQRLQADPRAQVPLTLPTPGARALPSIWHMGCGFEPRRGP